MAQKIVKHGLVGALVCWLGLAACSSATPTSMPTQDMNPFRTEVAATVFAQVTYDLALTPSITPIPSSTATITHTTTPILPTSASPGLTTTLSVATLAPATLAPATLAPTIALPDRAQWVSQTVPDDSVFAPGETFTMTWQIKNVGASTWTAGYLLRYYSGDLFGAPKEIVLGQEVLPGATVDITLKMKAPAAAGKYRSDWVLSSETRSNFKDAVFLKITVVVPPTATRAPTPSPTP